MEYTREDLAKDALIAAALRAVESENDVSESEILCYSAKGPELSAEDNRALATIGTNLFARNSRQTRTKQVDVPVPSNATLEESIMAMNRNNADDNISEETKKEIELKREDLRKRLKNERKQKKDGNANPGTH